MRVADTAYKCSIESAKVTTRNYCEIAFTRSMFSFFVYIFVMAFGLFMWYDRIVSTTEYIIFLFFSWAVFIFSVKLYYMHKQLGINNMRAIKNIEREWEQHDEHQPDCFY